MNIVMLCDWLPPDFGAVGQYAQQFAEKLSAAGHQVCLVGFSSQARDQTIVATERGSLTVRYLHRPSYDRSALVQRALWTIKANLALIWAARHELWQADEVRFTGSPPYLLHFMAPLRQILAVRMRYRITDFHPECLIAASGSRPWWLKIIERLTWFWRRQIDVIEVIGTDQMRRLLDGGIEPEQIELLRDPSPVQFGDTPGAAPLPAELRGRKVVLYSGNWGVAHDHETFAVGMGLFEQKHPGVAAVWLNATGARADQAECGLRAVGVTIWRTPPCPLADLPAVLLAADVHLITLADAFVGYVLPSKVYACIESGRPVLFVGSAESDVHALCVDGVTGGKYRRVSVGDYAAACSALEDLLMGTPASSA